MNISRTTTFDASYIKDVIRNSAGCVDDPFIVGNALSELSRLIEGVLRQFLLTVVSNYGELVTSDSSEAKIRIKELLEANFGKSWQNLSKDTFRDVTRHKLSDIVSAESLKAMNMLFNFRNIWVHGCSFVIAEDDNGLDYQRCKPANFIKYIHKEYNSGSLYLEPSYSSCTQMRFFLTVTILKHFYNSGVQFLEEIKNKLSEEADDLVLMDLEGINYNLTYDMSL